MACFGRNSFFFRQSNQAMGVLSSKTGHLVLIEQNPTCQLLNLTENIDETWTQQCAKAELEKVVITFATRVGKDDTPRQCKIQLIDDRTFGFIIVETNSDRVLSLTPAWIWTTDERGLSTFNSDGCYLVLGRLAGEMTCEDLLRAVHPEDAQTLHETWEKCFRDGSDIDTVQRFVRPTGETIWTITKAKGVFDSDGKYKGYVGVVCDITAERKVHESIAAALERAEAAAAAKDRFVATVSHELRNPLNGIIGMADLLKDTPINSDQKSLVNNILVCSEGLLNTVNDILDFRRIKAVSNVPFDFRACVLISTEILSRTAFEKGVTLYTKITESVPSALLLGDAKRVRQIFINLIGNAVKFTDDKGTVSVHVSAEQTMDRVYDIVTVVQDTGIGITSETLAKIFTPFEQGDPSIIHKYGGTGLGLAISRDIAKAMNGSITATSLGIGKGATFTFTAPFIVADENTLRNPPVHDESVKRKSLDHVPFHLLLAEDNEINRQLIVRLLTTIGQPCEIAKDGRECVIMTKSAVKSNNPYHLILMDIEMPELSGLEATVIIRADTDIEPQPWIIALSANAGEESLRKSLEAGMDEHVTKPPRKNELMALISRYSEKVRKVAFNETQ